ncbi:hypothetical protein RvY_17485 [Ramazzottius varieornatus]|uniref:Protein MAK10 homolog n=1 Tax=Ramazzottius varieornatus TaxID=947166 RepID=A0A1D1W2N4_RAMVA|nr:hypothetical protein RvY_17485 [Ramazzottius varieornatus]
MDNLEMCLLQQAVGTVHICRGEEESYEWKDITQDFLEWTSEMQEGELLSIPSFTLYDAMSAIELMDHKMDVGLLLKQRKVTSFQHGVDSKWLKLSGFSVEEYLAVIDRSLSNFVLWMQGHCVAQTVFTFVYLHRPQDIQDELMKSYCQTLLALTEAVRTIMVNGSVFEEEDFQVSSPFIQSTEEISIPSLAVLSKNLKVSEDVCSKNFRRLKSEEGQEAQLWNALALRFKFCKTLLQLLTFFNSPGSEKMFTEVSQLADVLLLTTEKIVNAPELSEEVLKETAGFEPLINLHLLPPSFPRHTPLTLEEKTFTFFHRLIQQVKVLVLLPEKARSMESLMFFLSTEGAVLDTTLTRSLAQIVISLAVNWRKVSVNLPSKVSSAQPAAADFVSFSIRAFSGAPVLLNNLPQLDNVPHARDYARTFVDSCVTLASNVVRIYGMNKARRRDALATSLAEWFSIQDDAEKLDEYFNLQLAAAKLNGLNHTFCFGSWTLHNMLNIMADYLFLGLDLELYADSELHFIYWYLYDVILHCHVQAILRADAVLHHNEAACQHLQDAAGDSRKNGKKKAGKAQRNGVDHEIATSPSHTTTLARLQTLHHLCGAFHFAILALKWQGKLTGPQQSLDCEELRYYYRLMAFMERNAPAFVDYGQYQLVKSVMARNKLNPINTLPLESEENSWPTIKDALDRSSINFQQAERMLGIWASEKEKVALSALCKRNDVTVRILATNSSKKVEFKFDLHPWFPSLKLS